MRDPSCVGPRRRSPPPRQLPSVAGKARGTRAETSSGHRGEMRSERTPQKQLAGEDGPHATPSQESPRTSEQVGTPPGSHTARSGLHWDVLMAPCGNKPWAVFCPPTQGGCIPEPESTVGSIPGTSHGSPGPSHGPQRDAGLFLSITPTLSLKRGGFSHGEVHLSTTAQKSTNKPQGTQTGWSALPRLPQEEGL